MSSDSVLLSTAIGAASGIAEVTCNQPLIFIKNAMQTGSKLPLNPLTYYRGYGVNLATLAPITAVQVAATGVYTRVLFNKGLNDKPNLYQSAASAMCAGMTSGLISGPSEVVILKQQATGQSALPTLRQIFSEGGIRSIIRGTQFAMLRDGGFTAGFMALGPFFTSKLKESGQSPVVSQLAGGIAAGLLSAIATHPFDTLKTRYQKDYLAKDFPTFASAVKEGKLFAGLQARGLRVMIGTIIIATTNDILYSSYDSYTKNKKSL